MFLEKTLDEGFPKTYDMPPILVTIGQWGCVEWLQKFLFKVVFKFKISLFSIHVQGLNP
jgi:hypothetical protein